MEHSEIEELILRALFDPSPADALARASRRATTTRERQLVAIASAHAAGDRDRVEALTRDHLVDHPDSDIAAWIIASSRWNELRGRK